MLNMCLGSTLARLDPPVGLHKIFRAGNLPKSDRKVGNLLVIYR